MKAVIQRVSSASIEIEGKRQSEISRGLLVFLGYEQGDTTEDLTYIFDKCHNLRIFEDDKGKFDKSVSDLGGEIMLVSQFTLLADCSRGRRPDFKNAMNPSNALVLYESTVEYFKTNSNLKIQQGVFGAHMMVSMVNDGPVTIILDSRRQMS